MHSQLRIHSVRWLLSTVFDDGMFILMQNGLPTSSNKLGGTRSVYSDSDLRECYRVLLATTVDRENAMNSYNFFDHVILVSVSNFYIDWRTKMFNEALKCCESGLTLRLPKSFKHFLFNCAFDQRDCH